MMIAIISVIVYLYFGIGLSLGLIELSNMEPQSYAKYSKKEKVAAVLYRIFLWMPYVIADRIYIKMKYGGVPNAIDGKQAKR